MSAWKAVHYGCNSHSFWTKKERCPRDSTSL